MLIYRIGSDENLFHRKDSFFTTENIQAFFNDGKRKGTYKFKQNSPSGWWNYGRKHHGTLKRRLRSLKVDFLHFTKYWLSTSKRITRILKIFLYKMNAMTRKNLIIMGQSPKLPIHLEFRKQINLWIWTIQVVVVNNSNIQFRLPCLWQKCKL